MATTIWDQTIDKNVDWGGDSSTGGAPVSGKRVQEFIKNSLNQKFGYLKYDKAALKYYVFADEENYNLYANDTTGAYAGLLLGTFDAPAPATITISNQSAQQRTVLLGSTDNVISFNYYIENSSGAAVAENVTMRMAFTVNGETSSVSETIPVDYDHYADEVDGKKVGSFVSKNISQYLRSEGNYTITVTLTGSTTSATTTFSFLYNVVELRFTTSFDNTNTVKLENTSFDFPYQVVGGAGLGKMLEMFIDGELLYQDGLGYGVLAKSSNESIGDGSPLSGTLKIYLKDVNGNAAKWPAAGETWSNGAEFNNTELAGKDIFSSGKHSLQVRFSIPGNNNTRIYSKTIYRDFIVSYPESDTSRYVYIMYGTDEIAPGTVRDPQNPIEFSCEQYTGASFNVSVYDSKGNDVVVNYVMTEHVGDNWVPLASPQHTVNASTNWIDTFIYNFMNKNDVRIDVSDGYTKQVQLQINVTITESAAGDVSEYDDNQLVVKYTALNRNNGETSKDVWTNESNYGKTMPGYDFPAQFNNVLWNNQSGWDGESLVLSNGATVTFPFNLFSNTFITSAGMTFELELETFNVQDDDIPIMSFTDPGNGNNAYIKIAATQAEMCTKNNVKLKTNFKDGERIKIAFVINPLKNSDDVVSEWNAYAEGRSSSKPTGYYNMLFIIVNGVLDRVCKWGSGSVGSDSFAWNNPQGPNRASFTIGNPDGKASVKLYSMRVYQSALTPEQEFTNYMYDAGANLYNIFQRNNVVDGNKNITKDAVKNLGRTPIIIVSTAFNELNSASNKKTNYVTNMQFIDPTYPELGFYARDIYLSCQGTSSMQYPIKNLRPYFGKTPDTKTTMKAANKSVLDAGGNVVPGETMEYTPEYLTEFWPYQEYSAITNGTTVTNHEDDIEDFVDTVECPLPLGTNKKVDADGYHKIAAGRTQAGRDAIATMWKDRPDVYGKKDYLYAKATDAQKAAGTPDYFIITDLAEAADKNLAVRDTGDLTQYFISTYRPVRLHDNNGENGKDGKPVQSDAEYEKRVREMRYAGVKLFTRKEYKAADGYEFGEFDVNVDGEIKQLLAVKNIEKGEIEFSTADGILSWDLAKTVAVGFKETKKKKTIYKDTAKKTLPDYYLLGAQWKQWPHHGFTDRWTLKADYAESSNTHNGGTGRLWGAAMAGVQINGVNVCQTHAQQVAAGINDFFDVRTSCDCRPSILFYKEFKGYDQATGKRKYNDAVFGGIYNIMTDKSSTKLFGFEDLYDENGTKVFDASKTQCWECLSNGSLIAQGVSLVMDSKNDAGAETSGGDLGDGRLIWSSYEARWPDTGQERHEGNDAWPDDTYGVESNALESFWQWVNFCMPAINYTVGGSHEGYSMNEYIALDMAEASALYDEYIALVKANANADEVAEKTLYIRWINANNDAYAAVRFPNNEYEEDGTVYKDIAYGEAEEYTDNYYGDLSDGEKKDAVFNPNSGIVYYRHDTNINYEDVVKTVNTATIGEWLRDNRNGTSRDIYLGQAISFDSQYRCFDENGEVDEAEQNKYLVDVYVWRGQGNKYKYINRFGEEVDYTQPIDPDDYLKDGEQSWANKTFMQFFSKTKYEHLDVYKCAAYYIYILRFCAVDQVIKNTMMATEGPTDSSNGNYIWWFINYDNDTILGVRNDGQLKFHWDCDRDTYDVDGNSYSYAGAKSVLWNNLGMDKDFMDIVATIDQAMFKQDLLSVNAVLGMYNDKQEGTWCERIYNEQEKIKYLETFQKDFSTDKYLLFMHGTRHSHRTWYVNHRWELYDSMWGTGSYLDKKIKYYLIVNDATPQNPVDFLKITAAAKYYFTTQSNNRTLFDHWFKELNSGESYTFKTTTTIAIGDPMLFVGPQKIKVLDFRPGMKYLTASISLAEAYTIANSDGTIKSTNWVDDAGSMMTKLLFGDGKGSCGITGISGLDNITTLEEIDLRNFKLIQQAPVIGKLVNLHRWRSIGSGNGMSTFTPAQGCTFYEVSLPASTTSIALNRVTFTKANENLVDATVNYTGSETAFKYCKTYDEATDTMVAHNDYTFNEETGESSGDFYVFDYTPTSSLSSVTFNNVTGLDTFQFIKDWMAAFEADGLTISGILDLQGIRWTGVTVKDVLDIYNSFDIEHFTGKVNLIGSGDNGILTEEEYNQIVNVFTEDAFKPGNSIVFNAAQNMFFGPVEGDTHVKTKYAEGDTTINGLSYGYSYYTVVRGEDFKVNATIFPVSEDTHFIYQLQVFNTQNNTWQTIAASGASYDEFVYNDLSRGITLTNKDGKATFTASENVPGGALALIRVLGVNPETGTPISGQNYSQNYSKVGENDKFIYIKLVEQVIPTGADMTVLEDNGGETPITPEAVKDTNVHTYVLDFGTKHNLMNVNVESMTVSLDSTVVVSSNEVATIVENSIVVDNANKVYSFQIVNKIPAASTNETVYINVTFATSDHKRIAGMFTYPVTVIYPESVIIKDANNNEVEDSIYINQTGSFNYSFTILPADYNVAIKNITIDSSNLNYTTILDTEISTEGFTLRIADNNRSGNYISFSDNDTLTFTFEPEHDVNGNIVREIQYSAAIIYPGDIRLTRPDFNANGTQTGETTTNANMYLVDNQGTTGQGTYKQIIGGGANNSINYTFSVVPSDISLGEVTESYHVEIDTAALGVSDITSTEAKIAIFNVADAEELASIGVDIAWKSQPDGGTVSERGCRATGLKGFELTIYAFSNDQREVNVTIPVKVTYDDNDNDENATYNKVITKTLTFKITRTIASATSYQGMESTRNGNYVVYAVDNNRCFYEIDWDYTNNVPVNPTYNTITQAHGTDPEAWVGVAIKYGVGTTNVTYHPICVALRGLDTTPMVPYLQNGQPVLDGAAHPELPYSSVIDADFPAEYSTVSGESLFNGYEITKYIVTNWGSTNADKATKWYIAYNELYRNANMVSGMKAYIPSIAELNAFRQCGRLINGMVDYLLSLGATGDAFTYAKVLTSGPYYVSSTFEGNSEQMSSGAGKGAWFRHIAVSDDGLWTDTSGGSDAGSMCTRFNGLNYRAFITINDEPLNS